MVLVMDAVAAFHPIVRRWFEERYAAPTAAQEQGWPAIARGRHTLISAPTGVGEDAGRLPDVRGRPGAAGAVGGAAGRDAGGVRVAAEGAFERHPAQPVGAAGGDDGFGVGDGVAAAGDQGCGAHGRHAGIGAAGDGPPPAAHPHHHARIAVHPADLRKRAARVGRGAHPHPRRSARGGGEQAGGAPEPVGGAGCARWRRGR